jgi:ribosomal protein L7/L12
MTKVIITGWHRNFLAISFVKLVRKATGEGLASAKNKLDRILEGQVIEIEIVDDLAGTFLREIEQIGAIAHISQQ